MSKKKTASGLADEIKADGSFNRQIKNRENAKARLYHFLGQRA